DRGRRTVGVGAGPELVQGLPLGLTAICLTPAALALRAGGCAPVWGVAALACAGMVMGLEDLTCQPAKL
ncbi:hypothetical protein Q604_UNBC15629G0001, partial [human gut metagenome]